MFGTIRLSVFVFSALSVFVQVIKSSPTIAKRCIKTRSTVASTATTTLRALNYCALNPSHTMCLYSGPSADCRSKTIFRTMTAATKNAILAKHNALRSQVALGRQAGQPAAADMMKMTWNTELEIIAQRLADQCMFDHDSNRNLLNGTDVGQNLYSSSSSAQSSNTIVQTDSVSNVQDWYNEVTTPGFSSASISPFVFSSGAGHYTQVVWATSSQVGCGMVYFNENPWYTTIVVCNYAVGGNMGGSSMYIPGPACSRCPTGTRCTSATEGLCA